MTTARPYGHNPTSTAYTIHCHALPCRQWHLPEAEYKVANRHCQKLCAWTQQCSRRDEEVACCVWYQLAIYLGNARVRQHAGQAADEAVLPRRIPGAEPGARLLEVVLLHDDRLLAAAADRRRRDGVLLRVPHRVKPRWEVVNLCQDDNVSQIGVDTAKT